MKPAAPHPPRCARRPLSPAGTSGPTHPTPATPARCARALAARFAAPLPAARGEVVLGGFHTSHGAVRRCLVQTWRCMLRPMTIRVACPPRSWRALHAFALVAGVGASLSSPTTAGGEPTPPADAVVQELHPTRPACESMDSGAFFFPEGTFGDSHSKEPFVRG